MSIRLRIRYQFRQFFNSFRAITLPAWVTGATAKILVVGLTVVLGVGYIFQTNSLSTSGYVTHTLENKVATAQNEIQKLEAAVAANQSLSSIQKRLPEVNMVEVASVKYISTDAAMAKR